MIAVVPESSRAGPWRTPALRSSGALASVRGLRRNVTGFRSILT
jgi:hypothetical protein